MLSCVVTDGVLIFFKHHKPKGDYYFFIKKIFHKWLGNIKKLKIDKLHFCENNHTKYLIVPKRTKTNYCINFISSIFMVYQYSFKVCCIFFKQYGFSWNTFIFFPWSAIFKYTTLCLIKPDCGFSPTNSSIICKITPMYDGVARFFFATDLRRMCERENIVS